MDCEREVVRGPRMDELDPIRELVVEAIAELERALDDGLPAQAPGNYNWTGRPKWSH